MTNKTNSIVCRGGGDGDGAIWSKCIHTCISTWKKIRHTQLTICLCVLQIAWRVELAWNLNFLAHSWMIYVCTLKTCKVNYSLISDYNYDLVLVFRLLWRLFCSIDTCFIIYDEEMDALALWEVDIIVEEDRHRQKHWLVNLKDLIHHNTIKKVLWAWILLNFPYQGNNTITCMRQWKCMRDVDGVDFLILFFTIFLKFYFLGWGDGTVGGIRGTPQGWVKLAWNVNFLSPMCKRQ